VTAASNVPDCAAFEARVDELAVDVVGEPARSALLGHAGACAACRVLLRETTEVADLLLHLAPSIEPAAGFESRAVARMGARGGRDARRWMPIAAAAAVVVVLVSAIAVLQRDDPSDISSAAIVTTAGDEIGRAELNPGAARVVLTIENDDWNGVWVCELRDGDGWVDVGRWTATDARRGVWATGIDERLTDATAMRIVSERGHVIATSEFE
jgi:hypothetical protein